MTETELFARVKVPKEVLPRFIDLGENTFVPLEAVIARHLDALFPGMELLRHAFFRVARDADFEVSDEADDLLRAVENELRQRRFGEVVRLEVDASIDRDLREFLIEQLEIEEDEVVDVDGLLDMTDLWQIHGLDGFGELRERPWTPVAAPPFSTHDGKPDVFAAMRAGDILVHHPYDSFAGSVERLVEQAVNDPNVLAIKMTVYRTSDDSALVPLADRGGRARQAGRVPGGAEGALRRAPQHRLGEVAGRGGRPRGARAARAEDPRQGAAGGAARGRRACATTCTWAPATTTPRRRASTRTSGCSPATATIAADVATLFNALTGAARPPGYQKALVAPERMRDGLLAEIEKTVEAHRQGEDARIVLKMNSLVDRRCIRALYEASQAGVRIDINVRGISCLKAGVPGVSENIRVVSIVGRFLEHSRIYGFHRGDERRYYIGSADLMPRNLDTRVELLTPVEEPALRAELEDTLERCFADDSFAWDLQPDGSWERLTGGTRSVHRELMERATGAGRVRVGRRPPPPAPAACAFGPARRRSRSASRPRRSRGGRARSPAAGSCRWPRPRRGPWSGRPRGGPAPRS